jgi:hypothetical protein
MRKKNADEAGYGLERLKPLSCYESNKLVH